MLLQGKVPWQGPRSRNPQFHPLPIVMDVPSHCFPPGDPRQEPSLPEEKEGLKSSREEMGRGEALIPSRRRQQLLQLLGPSHIPSEQPHNLS